MKIITKILIGIIVLIVVFDIIWALLLLLVYIDQKMCERCYEERQKTGDARNGKCYGTIDCNSDYGFLNESCIGCPHHIWPNEDIDKLDWRG